MPGDVDALLSTSAATAKKPNAEMLALIETERQLAKSSRSGVRPVAPEIARTRDLSTAVTAVHQAIELEAVAPPGIEVTVVVNEMVVLAPPPRLAAETDLASQTSAAPAPPAASNARGLGELVPRSALPALGAAARAARPAPSRSAGRGRRILAALLFAAIMAGALALFGVVVLRGGLGPRPQTLARDVLRLLR